MCWSHCAATRAVAQLEEMRNIARREPAPADFQERSYDSAHHMTQERSASHNIDPLAGPRRGLRAEELRQVTFAFRRTRDDFGAVDAADHVALAIVFLGAG